MVQRAIHAGAAGTVVRQSLPCGGLDAAGVAHSVRAEWRRRHRFRGGRSLHQSAADRWIDRRAHYRSVGMRIVGAAARAMLVEAAARRWNVLTHELVAADSVVSHPPTGRSARYRRACGRRRGATCPHEPATEVANGIHDHRKVRAAVRYSRQGHRPVHVRIDVGCLRCAMPPSRRRQSTAEPWFRSTLHLP